ncbi:MAG TPA: ribonuclease III [Casimicrobiaceae bacterium]|nr:ribonuclease III [Casimicrobiaceae bacterium]
MAGPDEFSARFGYTFRQPRLIAQALTHRSYGASHNERLEFVGDAVLNCVVALSLHERFPESHEGDLSRMRASLVNRDTLAEVARRIGIGEAIRLGEGEHKSRGSDRPSILADALEALYGAVFIDGGFDAAKSIIDSTFGQVLRDADPQALGKDAKTRLQEWLQARRIPVPEYRVAEVSGEAHAQTFSVECSIASLGIATRGEGSSRRTAEQAAAAAAYAAVTASKFSPSSS